MNRAEFESFLLSKAQREDVVKLSSGAPSVQAPSLARLQRREAAGRCIRPERDLKIYA